MNILFIGGTNFIGRAAAERLAAGGHTVTVFHRGKTDNPLPDAVQHIHGDLADLDDYRDTFRDLAPDGVVHMLLMEQGDATQMMRVFRGITERVIVISSMDVYQAWGRLLDTEPGEPLPVPLTEDSPLREERYPYRKPLMDEDHPRYYYDKIQVEQGVMRFRKPAGTVLRLPMVYGEYDPRQRLLTYVQRMQDGRPAIILDERAARWIPPQGYVGNIAHAIALVATDGRATNRIYHVAEPHTQARTTADYVRAVGEAFGWQGDVIAVPPDELPRGMRFDTHGQDCPADSTRIREELGYSEPFSFQEGLEKTIDWYRAQVLPSAEPIDYADEDAVLAKLG